MRRVASQLLSSLLPLLPRFVRGGRGGWGGMALAAPIMNRSSGRFVRARSPVISNATPPAPPYEGGERRIAILVLMAFVLCFAAGSPASAQNEPTKEETTEDDPTLPKLKEMPIP